MGAKLHLGLLLCLAITLAWLWMPQQALQGDGQQKARRYEYKVVAFGIDAHDEKIAARLTDEFNKVSDDGWEYVGPVFGWYAQGGGQGSFVLVKRAAR